MVSPLAGAVAVVLMAVWTLVPGATRDGVPTPTTGRFVVSRFQEAGTIIRGHPTPLPPVPSIVMVLAMAAGLAAVLGSSLWGLRERRSALVALAPSFSLVVYTALFSTRVDRAQDALIYASVALIFVVVSGRAFGDTTVRRRGMASGIAASALAVGVALVCSAGLAGMQLTAFPTPVGNGQTAVGGLELHTEIPDLIDNIQALLSNQSKNVMFTATSTLPTYWQVGILSKFNGTEWLPDTATRSAANGSYNGDSSEVLPALPEPNPTTTFSSQVTIAQLQATLLPVPPSTVAVTDPDISVFLPDIGLVQPIPAPAGTVYTTDARVPTVSETAVQPTGPPSTELSVNTSDLDFYLALPAVPKSVVTLAHHIVAGISGAFNQAAALARYFDTGKFTYTLYPTVEPGDSPLVSFLFATRAGFCQQFAGAYAVLARLDGLPTRLAIGFTPGTLRNGVYTVRGADSHVWPQVFLGPSTGWVSFEPTPAQAHESLAAGVVVGSQVKAPARSRSAGRASHAPGKSSSNPVTVPTVSHSAPAPVAPNGSKGLKPRNITHQAPTGPSARRGAGFAHGDRRPRHLCGNGRAGVTRRCTGGTRTPVAAASGGTRGKASCPKAADVDVSACTPAQGALLRRMTEARRPRSSHAGSGPFAFSKHPGWLVVRTRPSRSTRRASATETQQERCRGHRLRLMRPSADQPEPQEQPAELAPSRHTGLLADLATKASYASDPCTDEEAGRAKVLCEAVRKGFA